MDGARVAFEAMFRPCRAAVYPHKTRFMEDGFDLDLVYVTKRIIIHGVSSSNSDPFYEDPRTEVRRLLDKYHLDRYKVYNFASERGQVSPSGGEQKMDGRTESYPFTDDTCPPLESVVEFCENAKAWLDADVDNVVSLHCKGGKGRAGIMAACLMVRMGETAQAAVSKYDETQLSDTRGRTAANQRAWVFLYERLIREVWGLRDTIGTVSGQDPCLKAPPRLATSLREICLEMQTPPSRGNWRPVLYNPSCAVYQQTPGGKAMIHRAKMPPVCAGKKRGTPRSFSAALPRSVVVEGTFQVVVSAATGMFGLGKNVLDVWCNTTFLGDDGGQEVFNFTTNDLPPGTLAERLLASGVRVVITHSHPNVSISAASLGEKQAVASLDPSALRAETSARPSQTSVTIMSTSTEGNGGHRHDGNEGGGEEDVSTPETMQELSGSEDTAEEDKEKDKDEGVGLHGKLGEHATSLISERASVRQGGESPKRKRHSLRITVDDEAGWLAASARRSNRKLTRSTSAVEGFKNRLIDTHPSPLRSCPRSVAFRSERMVMSATQGNERILRRWASTSWQERIPRSLPVTPVSPGRRVVAVVRPMVPTATPDAIARVFERLGKQPYAATPSPPMEAKGFRSFSSGRERVIEAARTTGNDAYANVGVGASWRGDGGDNCGDNGDECISLEMEGREPKARARAQTEGAAGQLGRVDGVKSRRRELVINKTIFPEAEEITKAGVSEDGFELDDLESEDLTPGLTPSGSGLRRPFPTRRVLLETASEKSLEDIISCSHHTARSVPESGEDHVGQNTEIMNVEPMPSSECDDEKAANAARALAGWVDSKLQRPLCGLEATPTDGSSRLIAVVGGIASGSTKYIETEDLSSIPPLKHRGWPPAKPVVAGEMEVHDALMLDDDEEPPVRAIRKWGSAETSWGEEAKLALARKRLQWEKSRRGSYQGSESLRMHAAMIAKREAEILAIETDVKEAVRILEERIARRESAEVALDNWRRQLPPQAYQDVMSCLNGLGGLAATSATSA